MVDLSIIIVNWNAKSFLLKCLRSLISETKSCSVEIIVVDNASTDGSQQAVKKKFPTVKLIQNKVNSGFAKANNIGINQSVGRYICLINSDVTLLNGCLDKLCSFMDQQPEIGVTAPNILNSDLTLQYSCRCFPSLWNNFCPAIGLNKLFPKSKAVSGEEMFFFKHDRICEVDVLSGCFLMVRRKALEQVGPLDEQFFIYSEDIDWCRRFCDADWEIVFFPEAKAIHYGGGSSS